MSGWLIPILIGLGALLLGVVKADLEDAKVCRWLARQLIYRAAERLPRRERARWREEAIGDTLALPPGRLPPLLWALDAYLKSGRWAQTRGAPSRWQAQIARIRAAWQRLRSLARARGREESKQRHPSQNQETAEQIMAAGIETAEVFGTATLEATLTTAAVGVGSTATYGPSTLWVDQDDRPSGLPHLTEFGWLAWLGQERAAFEADVDRRSRRGGPKPGRRWRPGSSAEPRSTGPSPAPPERLAGSAATGWPPHPPTRLRCKPAGSLGLGRPPCPVPRPNASCSRARSTTTPTLPPSPGPARYGVRASARRSAAVGTAPTGSPVPRPAGPAGLPPGRPRPGRRRSPNVRGANMAKRTGARVDVAERDARALELRAAGQSFREIADRLGVSVSTAWKCVDRGLAATRQEPSAKLRVLERERLDRLTVAATQVLQAQHVVVSGGKIVTDDDDEPLVDHGPTLAAINTLTRLMERRARLEGLDEPVRADLTARLHAEVYSVDALDRELERVAQQLAEQDPEWEERERRQRQHDQALDRFQVAWSTPGTVVRDPARFVGDGLALLLEGLDLDDTQREQAAVEVERLLWNRADR